MSIARDLYQLQETELALEANDQSQLKISGQIGESREVNDARAKLAAGQKHVEDLVKNQKSAEWEIDDLTSKIKTIDKKLYDGKIFNPKELGSLQTEAEDFKKKRSALEDKVLDMMEQIDEARKKVSVINQDIARLTAAWQVQQKQLTDNLEKLKTAHSSLESKKQSQLALIDAASVDTYRELRRRKGTAVARVEQGTCLGCRITLPNSDLQQAKSGRLVRCSSCGRILYLP
jgi:predicted  nucleic acid-binding Zn-ribbon protein